VLADLPFVKSFDLEIGGRRSDYNTTGVSYTYKTLADWRMLDWLRVRGGYNRAERAPNVAELYMAPEQTFAVGAGGVESPFVNIPALSDLRLSADYYRIEITDAIGEQSADIVMQL
jgi:iron complex outermembrane recepter protein